MPGKTALIAGATGLVGGLLLDQLLHDNTYVRILSVSRKATGITHPKLKEIIIPFDDLEKWKDSLRAEHIFCCLGTTIGKAGSKEAFEAVDYGFPVKLAQITRANNASHFILVSAMGANKKSIFFYNRVKGRTEDAIGAAGFDFLSIIRPSLILGNRKEKRNLETLSKWLLNGLNFIFVGPFRKFRGVQASEIARTMREVVKIQTERIRIIPSDQIGHLSDFK